MSSVTCRRPTWSSGRPPGVQVPHSSEGDHYTLHALHYGALLSFNRHPNFFTSMTVWSSSAVT